MIRPKKIAPSLLSSDFCYMGRDIAMLEAAGADVMHIDVMDGHFVPNITIGIPVVAAIKKYATTPCDVHLMIEKPETYVEDFIKAGADIVMSSLSLGFLNVFCIVLFSFCFLV